MIRYGRRSYLAFAAIFGVLGIYGFTVPQYDGPAFVAPFFILAAIFLWKARQRREPNPPGKW